jgi:hypothetical protein
MQDQDEFVFVGYVENLWQALLRQMNKAAGNASLISKHNTVQLSRSNAAHLAEAVTQGTYDHRPHPPRMRR